MDERATLVTQSAGKELEAGLAQELFRKWKSQIWLVFVADSERQVSRMTSRFST